MSHNGLGVPSFDGRIRADAVHISLGHVTGMSFVHKFGANTAVGAVTREDLWSLGGVLTWPQAATTIRIKSGGDVEDDATGDGARVVTIEGLDETWAEASEDIITAGTSASASTTTTFIRVFRAWVSGSGGYTASNTDVITIENTAGTVDLCEIQAEYGQSQMSHYTVPLGKNAVLLGDISVTVDANQPSNVRISQRQNADIVAAPFTSPRTFFEVDSFVGSKEVTVQGVLAFPAKTDIWADALAAASTASINLTYDLVLVNV